MNPSVALLISLLCLLAAGWSSVCAIPTLGRQWPPALTITVPVAVVAWIVSGTALWLTGHSAPARPGVFAGYAATALGLAVIGIPAVARLGPVSAGLSRAVVLALLAFVCWRTETVWLLATPVAG